MISTVKQTENINNAIVFILPSNETVSKDTPEFKEVLSSLKNKNDNLKISTQNDDIIDIQKFDVSQNEKMIDSNKDLESSQIDDNVVGNLFVSDGEIIVNDNIDLTSLVSTNQNSELNEALSGNINIINDLMMSNISMNNGKLVQSAPETKIESISEFENFPVKLQQSASIENKISSEVNTNDFFSMNNYQNIKNVEQTSLEVDNSKLENDSMKLADLGFVKVSENEKFDISHLKLDGYQKVQNVKTNNNFQNLTSESSDQIKSSIKSTDRNKQNINFEDDTRLNLVDSSKNINMKNELGVINNNTQSKDHNFNEIKESLNVSKVQSVKNEQIINNPSFKIKNENFISSNSDSNLKLNLNENIVVKESHLSPSETINYTEKMVEMENISIKDNSSKAP